MCITCWEERGSPKVATKKVTEAAKSIAKIYDYNSVGSNLHIVLDDWNLEARNIDWCIKNAIPENIHESTESEIALEFDCATRLRELTLKERASALALYDGYFKVEDLVK